MKQQLCFKWNDNIESTSWFRDTLYTTVNNIIDLVKETPIQNFSDYKTQYEWNLEYDNIPFTIYDYKEEYEFNLDEKIYWHIGARNEKESNYITKILKNAINN